MMARLISHVRSVIVGGLALLLAACSSPTGTSTSVQNVLAHRAVWMGQGLQDYSYTYEFVAFNAYANHPLRLEVRKDTVRSVVVLATGENLDPSHFPTIDALFDHALGAAQNGSLTRITFDPTRGYPTVLGYEALPDALTSQRASDLQSLP